MTTSKMKELLLLHCLPLEETQHVYQITLPRKQGFRLRNVIGTNNDLKITFGLVDCENICLESLFVKSGQETKFP